MLSPHSSIVDGRDMPDPDVVDKVKKLLSEIFHDPKFRSRDYLYWLYWGGPDGPACQQNLEFGGRCRAHYCLVPQKFANQGHTIPFGYSLNLAVGKELRGKGVFIDLATKAHAKAVKKRSVDAVITVANANSTPGFLRRLGFQLVAQLPVRIGLRPYASHSGILSHEVNPAFLESRAFETICRRIDFSGGGGWQQRWSQDRLKWRLSSPAGRYVMHVGQHIVAITTGKRAAGLPIAIVLRVFPMHEGADADDRSRDLKTLLAAMCRAHGAFLYLYAGLNRQVRVPGISVPRKILPSPLNLLYRPLTGQAPAKEAFEPAVYEFLDFDVY